MDLRKMYKNSWDITGKMLNPTGTAINWAVGNTKKLQDKRQAPTMNNYKSNLNLTTYDPRYPGFDEEDYKKLEQGAINRGLTGEEKTQFMDEAYQYYYPQVLNQHGLDKRAEEINKTASENGSAILNGNKQAEYNMKLIDLAQTAKRVRGFAYDYPDEQIIQAMKTEIPDGEQLLLNYLNNGDDTILYKAGLKKTDAQAKADEYNKRKENINKALVENWKELSEDGLKYLRDYNVMFQTVDEARQEGLGQGMSDNELLLNLIYLSPELQQLEREINGLKLNNEDLAILGETTSVKADEWNQTKNNFRDWIGWNSDKPATINDIDQAIYVKQNGGIAEDWKNFKANLRNRGDSMEKVMNRFPKDFENFMNEYLPTKNVLELELGKELSDEEYDKIIEERKIENIRQVQAFDESLNKEIQASRERIGLDPIIDDYYSKQGIVESLFNGNGGAGYKLAGDVAGNRDMMLGVLGSAVNPGIGLLIMGTDTFARENQESFDNLINAQTKQGISYEDAYDNASKGAVIVGAVNTAIELGLEKFLGGVETTAGENIKKIITQNLNKEVSDMVAKRGIMEMLAKGLETQARSSLEEGMEEVFQQLVHNIAASGFDPDQEISEGLWQAFESGALNPMNLLAGGSELLTDTNQIKDAMYNSAYDAGVITRNVVDALNPKSIVSNIKNGGSNVGRSINPTTNETITRTIPEKIVESDLGLTSIERQKVENTGITPANFTLQEGLAGLKNEDRVIGFEQVASDAYNKLTEVGKNIDERVNREEVHWILDIMIDSIKDSKILQKRYSSLLNRLRELNNQSDWSWSEVLAIKRDFDLLEGSHIFNNKGEVKNSDFEKSEVAEWRNILNDELDRIGDNYDIDVRKENNRIRNAITIRNGLLRAMSNQNKNNYLGLQDLGFGAVLSSGNPIQTAALIGVKKYAESKAGKLAQSLYNRNDKPLDTTNTKRGAGFINKKGNNANRFSVLNTPSGVYNPTTEGLTQEIIDAGDLGNIPLDTIPDRNVGVNPTDTVISENVNEMAGNQAQELYNQGDKNLSPNSEQMIEVRSYTAEELGLPPVSATMLKNLDRSKYIPVEDPQTKKVEFYKVEELEQIPIYDSKGNKVNFDRTYTSKELGLDKDDKTSAYFEAIANTNRHNIEKDINNLQIGQEIRYENEYGYGYGGRILKGKDGMVVEYDGVDGVNKVKQADIKEWIDNHKILGYIVIDDTNNNETYADEAYRPSITMKVDDYIDEGTPAFENNETARQATEEIQNEMNMDIDEELEDMLRNDDMAESVGEIKEYYDDLSKSELEEELKDMKNTYDRDIEQWQKNGDEEAKYNAAIANRTMKAIRSLLAFKSESDNSRTKQYADNSYRPSITMKVDEYETTPTKKVYYDSSEALTNGIGEGYNGPHGYGYYTNTEENEVLRNIHDNGGKDYKGFVYEIEIPEETDKNTPTRSNYFDENYEWSKTDVDNLLKSIEKIDENLWDKAMDTVLSNLSKYEKIPGHQIYNILSQISVGNKNASELLNKIGYDGIKYNNSFGSQYVVFDKDNVNIGRNYGYNEDRFVRSKGGTQKIQEGYITSKPTEVKYIDKDGNWLSEQHNKDENNLIKVNYHPDGYLNVKLSRDMSSDEMIGFEEFKDHPIKEVEYTIVDDQTGRPITNNRVNTIDEFLEEVEDYFEERGVNGKAYADESYKPSITMKVDMNKEIIKTIKDMNIWDKLGFVDKFNRKGVLERTNEGYEYHFLNDPEEGSSSFPTVLSDMDIIGFTEPYYGAADPDYSDILSPKETKQESKPKKEKPLTKKQVKEEINDLISDTWSDIGDEGDWDWYKKMKKKDVITYLEDQVGDEFSDARKRGYDYGLEWGEVQKLIKKFVNQKMK